MLRLLDEHAWCSRRRRRSPGDCTSRRPCLGALGAPARRRHLGVGAHARATVRALARTRAISQRKPPQTDQIDAWTSGGGELADPDGGLDDDYGDALVASWGDGAPDDASRRHRIARKIGVRVL